MFNHPRQGEIDAFQAARMSCEATALQCGGTSLVAQDREPDFLGVFEAPNGTVVVIHQEPSRVVLRAVERIRMSDRTRPGLFLGMTDLAVSQRGMCDEILYLDPRRFRPTLADGIRPLQPEDSLLLTSLHDAVERHERWYVEISHAGLFGCVRDGAIVSAASHIIEKGHAVTDLGVLTRPAFRRRGLGKAVVSASIPWGLDRDLICQWATTDRNEASLALARSLGFELYGTETELRINCRGR